jgi:hypothetical protein
MTHPLVRRTVWLAGVAALAAAAPALASEGTPAGPVLPNPLSPVAFPPTTPPASAPGMPTPAARRAARLRVSSARVVPRRVVRGHRARLRLRLAAPLRVRVVLERGHRRVRVFNVPAGHRNVSLRLPRTLRVGRYRLRIVVLDEQGARGPEVRRSLRVVRRAR